ncbi:MAG: CHASE2 domain-containing protein, partial [Fibrobacterota bacterium]
MKWLKLVIIFIVLSFLYLKLPVAFRDYDASILNLFYKMRGPVNVGERVVIAAINDASIVEYGDWPWTRIKIAELVDFISACKPSVIVLNFYFRKKSILTTDEKDKVEVQNENRVLAATLRKAGNVIIPFNFEKFQDEQSVTALEAPPDKIQQTRFKNITNTSGNISIIPAKVIHSPEPEIAESAKALGFNNVLAGIHHYTLQAVQYGNAFYPSIAIAAAVEYLKCGMDGASLDIGNAITLKDGRALPIDDYGISMINFCGGNAAFPNYTASEILGKNFNPGLLRDKIVIVGLTDKRNGEPNKTPYSDNLPASELWANVIENILSGNTPFIRFSSVALMLFLPLLIILGLAFLTQWCLTRRFRNAFIAIAAAFIILLLLSFILFLFNLWLSALIPLFYLTGLGVFLTIRSFRHSGSNAENPSATTALGANTAIFTPAGQLVRIGRYQVQK